MKVYILASSACLKHLSVKFKFCDQFIYYIFTLLSVWRSRSLLHSGTSSSGSNGRRTEPSSDLRSARGIQKPVRDFMFNIPHHFSFT